MEIKGVYQKTVFRNSFNNHTVFTLKLKELVPEYKWLTVSCIGNIYASCIGMPVKLRGEFKNRPGTNIQDFYFDDMELISTTESEIRELPSFKGISEEIIKELTAMLGVNVFNWANIPDLFTKLTSIDGIGSKKAQKIIDGITKYRKQQEFYEYVSSFGEVPVLKASTMSSHPMEDIKNNPYTFGKKCSLSFRCCDAIALHNNIEANDPKRIRGIIHEVLTVATERGNTCLPLQRVLNGVMWMNQHSSSYPTQKLSSYAVFAEIVSDPDIDIYNNISKDSIVYFKREYNNEKLLCNNIKRLKQTSSSNRVNIERIIEKTEKQLNIKYNDTQKESFNFLLTSGLKVLTGGPGTGKTTVINGLIHAYQTIFPDNVIVMMAPTGRASQRMAEVTGRDAGTIHRMFNLKTLNGASGELEQRTLVSDFVANYPADLIIIDEASMLDNELAAYALSSIKGGSTVILVGDVNQLPSVGPGNVLQNLLESGYVDTVLLNVNYRQGNVSTIAVNAEKIKNGETDIVSDDSFHLVKCNNKNDMMKQVTDIFLKEYDKDNPFKTQILCAVKDGSTGVFEYNNKIQKLINSNRTIIKTRYYEFKVGDKVIITVNNYEDLCFNGDIGIITDISDAGITINLGDREVTYTKDRYDEIHLAYSMSIHKSQGSEYENVIICLPESKSNMLKRRLLYTAVTRAKKNVYIFYTDDVLSEAIINNNDVKRISQLRKMLTDEE